jgi:hypothetical protein
LDRRYSAAQTCHNDESGPDQIQAFVPWRHPGNSRWLIIIAHADEGYEIARDIALKYHTKNIGYSASPNCRTTIPNNSIC